MKKRTFLTMLAVALLSLAMTITAFAGEWKKDHIGWWYQNDDGSYSVNAWQWIDGNKDGIAECYYFDSVGYMWENDKPTPDGYLVDANGAWISNGVVQTKQVEVPTTPAPAVTETAQQTEDFTGMYGCYDWGLGTYTTDFATMNITKNADGSYHVSCNYKYAPFEFDCQVEMVNGHANFSDPAGEAFVKYNSYSNDYDVFAGASVESFGKLK